MTRGSAAVEFLLVSILITTLLAGVLQLAYVSYLRVSLGSIAERSVRTAALADHEVIEATARAEREIHDSLGIGTRVELAVTELSGIVELRLRYRIPVFGVPIFTDAIEVSAHARREQLP